MHAWSNRCCARASYHPGGMCTRGINICARVPLIKLTGTALQVCANLLWHDTIQNLLTTESCDVFQPLLPSWLRCKTWLRCDFAAFQLPAYEGCLPRSAAASLLWKQSTRESGKSVLNPALLPMKTHLIQNVIHDFRGVALGLLLGTSFASTKRIVRGVV